MAEKACGRLLLLFTRIPKIDRCERPSVILAEAVGGYSSAFEASRRSPILKPVTGKLLMDHQNAGIILGPPPDNVFNRQDSNRDLEAHG